MLPTRIVRIQLSPLFERLLSAQEHLVSAARTALDRYSHWLSFSTIPFFPEYTDHGLMHLSSVIQTAEGLLNQPSKQLLTPSDAAVFVIAVVLHDIAMHLTEDGFVRLVNGTTHLKPVPEFGDRNWTELWEDFKIEARRFSHEQNVELFGEANPVPVPSLDDTDWTKKQRMLIGEFIRRHHPQLAHQIALHGFPGSDAEAFSLDNVLTVNERNLIGLIARSHGVDLRPCVDYLEREFFNRIDPLGVKAVFAMCLIRTADYFQMESSRSSAGLRVSSIRSTRSLREHAKHAAVLQLTRDSNDQECYRVIVDPREVKFIRVYLDLRELFQAVQQSIDFSWAILGEVYSRQTENGVNCLGMSVRRLRSNLDDPNFLRQVGFEPVHIKLTASEKRLFKLLLQPLYGQDPNIGVRELAQNAIDAVRERTAYLNKHGLDSLPDGADVTVDLEISDDGEQYVVIKDRGIGMTIEIIRDYFLKVGSSLRQSAFWKKEFTDDQQRSTVLRTGYFGIGALAAFLIGDEIEVVTRHVSSQQGFAFRTAMDTDPIQIQKVDAPIGTSIRIRQRTSDDNWTPHLRFFLKSPTVMIMGQKNPATYPDVGDALTPEWREVPDVERPLIRWTRPSSLFTNRVTLNGFEIEHGDQPRRVLWSSRYCGLTVFCPHLHIIDYDGGKEENNYINLARNTFFQEQFQPLPHVFNDVLRDMLGFLLTVPAQVLQKSPASLSLTNRKWWDYGLIRQQLSNLKEGLTTESVFGSFWSFTAQGLVPFDGPVFDQLGITTIVFTSHWDPSFIPQDQRTALVLIAGDQADKALLGHGSNEFSPAGLHVVAAKCVMLDISGNEVMSAGTLIESTELNTQINRLISTIRQLDLREESCVAAWTVQGKRVDSSGTSACDIARMILRMMQKSEGEKSPLVQMWCDIFGSWIIPFDEATRKSMFEGAYSELEAHMAAWESLTT